MANRGRETESRRQKTDDRRQKTEDRRQKGDARSAGLSWEPRRPLGAQTSHGSAGVPPAMSAKRETVSSAEERG